jgi:hypothetical protein
MLVYGIPQWTLSGQGTHVQFEHVERVIFCFPLLSVKSAHIFDHYDLSDLAPLKRITASHPCGPIEIATA